jgi:hypothetical protein
VCRSWDDCQQAHAQAASSWIRTRSQSGALPQRTVTDTSSAAAALEDAQSPAQPPAAEKVPSKGRQNRIHSGRPASHKSRVGKLSAGAALSQEPAADLDAFAEAADAPFLPPPRPGREAVPKPDGGLSRDGKPEGSGKEQGSAQATLDSFLLQKPAEAALAKADAHAKAAPLTEVQHAVAAPRGLGLHAPRVAAVEPQAAAVVVKIAAATLAYKALKVQSQRPWISHLMSSNEHPLHTESSASITLLRELLRQCIWYLALYSQVLISRRGTRSAAPVRACRRRCRRRRPPAARLGPWARASAAAARPEPP